MGDRTGDRGREGGSGRARPAGAGAEPSPPAGEPGAPAGPPSLDDYDFGEVAPAAVLRVDLLLDAAEPGER